MTTLTQKSSAFKLALLLPLLFASTLYSQQKPMVLFPVPTAQPATPQTPADEENGRQKGRALPPQEVLRPTVDPAIAAFEPKLKHDVKGSINGAGSDVVALLCHQWIDAFRKFYPNVSIAVDPPYAGSIGAKELINGKLDFVVVSRELKPDDLTDFLAKFHYMPLSVPISGGSFRAFGFLDSVVIIVNKDNPIESLTFTQLDAAFSKTRHRGASAVTTWGDLGLKGDWASKPVHLYGIKPWNGFEEFVRQRVLSTPGNRGEWRDDITFDKLVFPVAGRVASDPYALGYTGMAYVDHPVKILALSADGGEAISPTYSEVSLARYPLSRVIYFNTNKAPGKPLNPIIDEFMRFILSRQGQDIVQSEGVFLPLRQFQIKESLATMSK